MYVCTETWARALLVWVSAGREGTSRMPCIGKREMRKSSPLFTRHPFSCVTQFNALITLCTQVPVLTPTFPIYSFGSRILWCIPHPQLVQDFSFQTTNHVSHPPPTLQSSCYYRLPVVACSASMIRGCVLAAEFSLRAILVVLLPQTKGLENGLLIKLHVRLSNTTFVACRFMEHSKPWQPSTTSNKLWLVRTCLCSNHLVRSLSAMGYLALAAVNISASSVSEGDEKAQEQDIQSWWPRRWCSWWKS